MNELTEMIRQIRKAAQAADCTGVVIHAKVTLTLNGAEAVLDIPIPVREEKQPSSGLNQKAHQ